MYNKVFLIITAISTTLLLIVTIAEKIRKFYKNIKNERKEKQEKEYAKILAKIEFEDALNNY